MFDPASAGAHSPRPFPLVTATLISYAVASAMSLEGGIATEVDVHAAPTPYSAAHAAIPDVRAGQAPTF
jgi:hypothetical protein